MDIMAPVILIFLLVIILLLLLQLRRSRVEGTPLAARLDACAMRRSGPTGLCAMKSPGRARKHSRTRSRKERSSRHRFLPSVTLFKPA